ncbi:MAG: LacI family DNA-binding transcriptional regulator [Pseudomonadota bacterium]
MKRKSPPTEPPAAPGMPERRSRLRDVAEAAGVSVATVSRVLNKATSVSDRTRRKIEAAISDLGYTPNPVARALTHGRTRVIAAVIPTLGHSIFSRFLHAIEDELAEHGYTLVVATTRESPAVEQARTRALLEMGAEGVILSGTERDPALVALVSAFRVPAVLTSVYEPGAAFPTIGYDNAALARRAVRHLVSLGHRRIAVLHGPALRNDRTRARLAGVAAELEAAGGGRGRKGRRPAGNGHGGALPAVSAEYVEAALSEAGGCAAAARALAAGGACGARPTALLCLSDVMALGALFELQRAGLSVPGDVSVMGFDNIAWSGHAEPALTTIALPVERMGRAAASALINRLEEGAEIQPQLLPGRLVIRASTGPAPAECCAGAEETTQQGTVVAGAAEGPRALVR